MNYLLSVPPVSYDYYKNIVHKSQFNEAPIPFTPNHGIIPVHHQPKATNASVHVTLSCIGRGDGLEKTFQRGSLLFCKSMKNGEDKFNNSDLDIADIILLNYIFDTDRKEYENEGSISRWNFVGTFITEQENNTKKYQKNGRNLNVCVSGVTECINYWKNYENNNNEIRPGITKLFFIIKKEKKFGPIVDPKGKQRSLGMQLREVFRFVPHIGMPNENELIFKENDRIQFGTYIEIGTILSNSLQQDNIKIII